jgi:hypothetical protein
MEDIFSGERVAGKEFRAMLGESDLDGRRRTMRTTVGLALALLAGLACDAAAQDGGKIGWQGKGKTDDVGKIMEQAKKDGKAMMLFFTAEG